MARRAISRLAFCKLLLVLDGETNLANRRIDSLDGFLASTPEVMLCMLHVSPGTLEVHEGHVKLAIFAPAFAGRCHTGALVAGFLAPDEAQLVQCRISRLERIAFATTELVARMLQLVPHAFK